MSVVKLYVDDPQLKNYIEKFVEEHFRNCTLSVEFPQSKYDADYSITKEDDDINIMSQNTLHFYYTKIRRTDSKFDEVLIKLLQPSDMKYIYVGSCNASTVSSLKEYPLQNVRILTKIDEFKSVSNFDNVYVLDEAEVGYLLIDSQGNIILIDENLESLIDVVDGTERTKINLILEYDDRFLHDVSKHFHVGIEVLDSTDEQVLTSDPAVTYSLLKRKGGYQLLHHLDGSQTNFKTLAQAFIYLRKQSRES